MSRIGQHILQIVHQPFLFTKQMVSFFDDFWWLQIAGQHEVLKTWTCWRKTDVEGMRTNLGWFLFEGSRRFQSVELSSECLTSELRNVYFFDSGGNSRFSTSKHPNIHGVMSLTKRLNTSKHPKQSEGDVFDKEIKDIQKSKKEFLRWILLRYPREK